MVLKCFQLNNIFINGISPSDYNFIVNIKAITCFQCGFNKIDRFLLLTGVRDIP